MADSIVIFEPDPVIGRRMADQLRDQGFVASWSQHALGRPGIGAIYAAVIIGPGLAMADAIGTCQRLRSDRISAPIFVVMSFESLDERIRLLDAGADGYLAYPANGQELAARIRACIRHSERRASIALMAWDELVVDLSQCSVLRRGCRLMVKPTGLRILSALVRHAPDTLPRRKLCMEVWGEAGYMRERTLRSHIFQLRDAVDRDFDRPLIETVYAGGYRLSPPSDRTHMPGRHGKQVMAGH